MQAPGIQLIDSQLNDEILWKAAPIAAYLLVQPLSRYLIQLCQIRIEQYAMSSDDENAVRNHSKFCLIRGRRHRPSSFQSCAFSTFHKLTGFACNSEPLVPGRTFVLSGQVRSKPDRPQFRCGWRHLRASSSFDATSSRSFTNARTTYTDISTARGLLRMVAARLLSAKLVSIELFPPDSGLQEHCLPMKLQMPPLPHIKTKARTPT